MKKVYIVVWESDYEDENTQIIDVFDSEQKAVKFINHKNETDYGPDNQHYEWDVYKVN